MNEQKVIATPFGSSLYPLGYRAAGVGEELAELMVTYPQAFLVDVRYRARSRWFPAWNKGALQTSWGDRYRHEKGLGNINYRSPQMSIRLVDPQPALCRLVSLLQSGSLLIVMCGCPEYELCHRKLVVESILQRCADVLPADGMRFDLASGFYVGMLADGQYKVVVRPELFDQYRPAWQVQQLYDPLAWARVYSEHHASYYLWVDQLKDVRGSRCMS